VETRVAVSFTATDVAALANKPIREKLTQRIVFMILEEEEGVGRITRFEVTLIYGIRTIPHKLFRLLLAIL
jgi:hypothetical protein